MTESEEAPLCFSPVGARSYTIRLAIQPLAFDYLSLSFIRAGSAIVLGDFGERPVAAGDVLALAEHTFCGIEPEGTLNITTMYLDMDYISDQVFWQHSDILTDRVEARYWMSVRFPDPVQVFSLGENQMGQLHSYLDGLVALSTKGSIAQNFYRSQALTSSIFEVLSPYVKPSPTPCLPIKARTKHPSAPRHRSFAPVRGEVLAVIKHLRDDPSKPWTVLQLADLVHLSPSQLNRLFVEAYGKTPMTFLRAARAESLAFLLRETDLPIEKAMRQTGWNSRGHAARAFRQAMGVTPSHYRRLRRQGG